MGRRRTRAVYDLADIARRLQRVIDLDTRRPAEPRTRSVHIRMSPGELGQLRARASARGMSISAYVVALVDADALPEYDDA